MRSLTLLIFCFIFIHPIYSYAEEAKEEKLRITPLQISLGGGPFYCDNCEVRGLSLNLPSGNAKHVKGLEIGLINVTEMVQGVQLGFWNESSTVHGVQVGVINSSFVHEFGKAIAYAAILPIIILTQEIPEMISDEESGHKGLQIGILNQAVTMSGVQLGVLNHVEKLNGLQVGIANIEYEGNEPDTVIPFIRFKKEF